MERTNAPGAPAPATGLSKVQVAIMASQAVGIWVVAALLLAQLFAQFGTNSRLTAVEAELDSMSSTLTATNAKLASISSAVDNSPVLKLDVVKMRGSDTWTLPTSSIAWSGK